MKNLKNMGKSGLALFLVLVMCMGMLQITAFAAEEDSHQHNEGGWTCTWTEPVTEKECQHTHTEDCYTPGAAVLDCETEEHTHGASCHVAGEDVLGCEDESEDHEHTEDCYTPGEAVLVCEKEEHTHGADCYVAGEDVSDCQHVCGEDCVTVVTEGCWTCTAPSGGGDNEPEEEGIYTFDISEDSGSAEGYTYDSGTCTMTVVVSDSIYHNDVKVTSVTYGAGGDAATFTNQYTSPDEPKQEDPQTTDLTVNKVWANDTEANRPESVTVQLYSDGEMVDNGSVTLSDSNGWTYTWEGLEEDHNYTVVETNVPENYSASYSTHEGTITITNTYSNPGNPGNSGNPGNPGRPSNSTNVNPTSPEETETELPEEDVPLAEIPEEDVPLAEIPEEDVPLAEIPEEVEEILDEDIPLADLPEEEIVIPDEDVPLANVPKTGDITALWYMTALLSACGLAVLGLLRRQSK